MLNTYWKTNIREERLFTKYFMLKPEISSQFICETCFCRRCGTIPNHNFDYKLYKQSLAKEIKFQSMFSYNFI